MNPADQLLRDLEEERREKTDHQDCILALREVLTTTQGKLFIKTLFKKLEIMELPEIGLEGSILSDRLGSLRAGRLVFDLVSEANQLTAAQLLAEIEKEKYVYIQEENSDDAGD